MVKPLWRNRLFLILSLILIIASMVYLKPIRDKKDYSYHLTQAGVVRIGSGDSLAFSFGRTIDLASFSLGFADRTVRGSTREADIVYRFLDIEGNLVEERKVPLDVILEGDIYTIRLAGERPVGGVGISVTGLAEGDTVGIHHFPRGSGEGLPDGAGVLLQGEDIGEGLSVILGTPSRYRTLFLGVIAALLLLYLLFAFWVHRHPGLRVETVFVVLAATFGLLIVLLQPQFQGFDEYAHFYRAFHVAQGNPSVEGMGDRGGGILPDDIVESFRSWFVRGMPFGLDHKIDTPRHIEAFSKPRDGGTMMYSFGNTRHYRFTSYLPASMGILLADAAGLPIAWVLIAGRLVNLAAWLLLTWLALRVMPFHKELILLVSFLPINIMQASSLSPDSLLNSLSLLLVAYVLCRAEAGRAGWKGTLIILFLALFLASIKLPYILMGLFGLIIPIRKHHERIRQRLLRHRLVLYGLLALVPVLAAVSVIAARRLFQVETMGGGTLAGLITILQDPVFFVNTLFRTFAFNLQRYTEILVGVIGWDYRAMPFTLTYGYIAMMLLTALRNIGTHPEHDLRPLEKGLSAFLVFGLVLGIFVVGFTWNLEPDQTIWGVQGRYFIPVVLPFLLLLDTRHVRATFTNAAIYLFGAWTLTYTVMTMVSRYYF